MASCLHRRFILTTRKLIIYLSVASLVEHSLTFDPSDHATSYTLSVSCYNANGSYVGGEYRYGTYDEVNGLTFSVPYNASKVRFYLEAKGVGYTPASWNSNNIAVQIPKCVGYNVDSEKHYALDAEGNVLWSGEHEGYCDRPNYCVICEADGVTLNNKQHLGDYEIESVNETWHHSFCTVCKGEIYR